MLSQIPSYHWESVEPKKIVVLIVFFFFMGFKEGETIRINVKPKPTTNGTGMLSAALSGNGKPKHLALAPPPNASIKTRSPLPPPPNDPVTSRIVSDGCKDSIDNSRRRNEPLSDLSQLKVKKPGLLKYIGINEQRH